MKPLRLFLLLTASLALFCACSGGDLPADDNTTAESTASAQPELVIAGNGASDYAIIRPDKGDTAEVDAAVRLFKAVEEATGVAPVLTTDWVKNEADIPADAPEILIGSTNRAESAACIKG